uniref:Uncharacterized protein n=1 Tax=Cacopsylla melanoneura TaxID=428564 RepID=A0A8D9ABQ7_9HEMI
MRPLACEKWSLTASRNTFVVISAGNFEATIPFIIAKVLLCPNSFFCTPLPVRLNCAASSSVSRNFTRFVVKWRLDFPLNSELGGNSTIEFLVLQIRLQQLESFQ